MQAQNPDFNLTLVSNVVYDEGCNDIWGYVDQNGIEYAVLGTRTATAILKLEDPANPEQVYRVDGSQSTWRDMKSWGTHVYSVCDDCPDGLVIIDMTDPTNIQHKIMTEIPDQINGTTASVGAVHNLWMDEFGYLYFAGGDLNSGGLTILDVKTDPWNPVIVGYGPARYSHDTYVRANIAYSCDIYSGFFSVLDVTDKANVQELATQKTITEFTHNCWLSDDSTVLYTTDEETFAYVESYDVSDPSDIKRLDFYRPPSTEDEGVIPHNAHVYNDYVIVSFYTDGIKIIDAQYPDNMIEVGSFDTWTNPGGGFNGNWGAYPFLPSGLILISDIQEGLFVLEPNYVRAGYLIGEVTDAQTGLTIPGVQVDIMEATPNNAQTNNFGTYRTGIANAGSFDVRFTHPVYNELIVNVPLQNDSTTVLDVQLSAIAGYVKLGGQVLDGEGQPVANANVLFEEPNGVVQYSYVSDENGNYGSDVFDLAYNVSAGAWGYGDTSLTVADISAGEVTINLPGKGEDYFDRFVADQNWAITNDAQTGDWERGVPQGTDFQGPLAPSMDSDDFGDKCYVTGLESTTAFDNDVDGAYNLMLSPEIPIDANVFGVTLNFEYWYRSVDVQGASNDSLFVEVYFDGQFVTRAETITTSATEWRSQSIELLSMLPENVGMLQIGFRIGDPPNPGAPLEGAIDNVSIELVRESGVVEPAAAAGIQVYPNPVADYVQVDVNDFEGNISGAELFNSIGQLVARWNIEGTQATLPVNAPAGYYNLQLIDEDGQRYNTELIKQ